MSLGGNRNINKHSENKQTPHRKDLGWDYQVENCYMSWQCLILSHVPTHKSASSWNIRERLCHDVHTTLLPQCFPTVMMDTALNATMLADSLCVCVLALLTPKARDCRVWEHDVAITQACGDSQNLVGRLVGVFLYNLGSSANLLLNTIRCLRDWFSFH